jgi:hypothetical protein
MTYDFITGLAKPPSEHSPPPYDLMGNLTNVKESNGAVTS